MDHKTMNILTDIIYKEAFLGEPEEKFWYNKWRARKAAEKVVEHLEEISRKEPNDGVDNDQRG